MEVRFCEMKVEANAKWKQMRNTNHRRTSLSYTIAANVTVSSFR